VASQFVNFVSHLQVLFSGPFSCVVYFTAALHAGSLVSCHNFLSFLICLNKWSRSGVSYFRCKSVVFLIDSLYTEATEAEKSRAALLAWLEE
jgi:hypothetical protein